jgi:hypothetical protein
MDVSYACVLQTLAKEAASWAGSVDDLTRLASESENHARALLFLSIWWLMSGTATLILWRTRKPSYWLLVAEALAFLQIPLPFYPPYKALRFFMGLFVFSSSISIHSRVWDRCRSYFEKEEPVASTAATATEATSAAAEAEQATDMDDRMAAVIR